MTPHHLLKRSEGDSVCCFGWPDLFQPNGQDTKMSKGAGAQEIRADHKTKNEGRVRKTDCGYHWRGLVNQKRPVGAWNGYDCDSLTDSLKVQTTRSDS